MTNASSGAGDSPPSLATTNERITYHSEISEIMTAERTSLESGLIPVTAYILVSAAECFHRHPEMAAVIDAAMPAEEIGRRARRPGCRVNAVHLWSIANIYLTGRKFLGALPGMDDRHDRTGTLLDFWERATRAFHGGHRQAWDVDRQVMPYDDATIANLLAGTQPVDDPEQLAGIKRFNATMMGYLFLLYFDTRVGTGDTGPYRLPDGRVLLVRDFYRLGQSADFWWSSEAPAISYPNLTAALVLEDVELAVNDWGTSITKPEDYLDRLVAFGLFASSAAGELEPVPPAAMDTLVSEARASQAALYRSIARMDRHEKIRCGASVYFGFLKPFAEEAGVASELDWSVPRDCHGPLYDMLSAVDGSSTAGVAGEGPYYVPYADA
ncbi:MAG: hypothetical protein ACR2H3_08520 [Acidimicrobiales bacterium]